MEWRRFTGMCVAAGLIGTATACGSDSGDGRNVANYSEEPIAWNDAAADDALNGMGEVSQNGSSNLGVEGGSMTGANMADGYSATGNDAEPVEKKKR